MSWEAEKANNGGEVSNLFASYFKSIYTNQNVTPTPPRDGQRVHNNNANLLEFNISYDEVF